MKRAWNIWVVGGDMRQVKLAELLSRDGHSVHAWALEGSVPPPGDGVRAEDRLEGISLADLVVLPLPVLGEGGALNAPLSEGTHTLKEVLRAAGPSPVLCGGRVTAECAETARLEGVTIHDYFQREELAMANAVPTASAIGHGKGRYGRRSYRPFHVFRKNTANSVREVFPASAAYDWKRTIV